jgi:hypothetical protein
MVSLQGLGPPDAPSAEPIRTWNFVSGRPTSRREKEQTRFVVRAYASRNRHVPSTSRTPSPKSDASSSPEHSDHQVQHGALARDPGVLYPRRQQRSPIFSVSTQSTCTYDPFETYPSDLPRRLIDQLMPSILIQTSQLLPPLKPTYHGESRWGDFTIAWLRSATHDRAMFHVALFASMYNARMFTDFATPQTRDEIVCQQIVIREISAKMSDSTQNTSNEALQAVGCLSLHPDSLPMRLPRAPQQGPFQELQMLHMYGGTLSRSNPHIRAMNAIIRATGGIDQVNWRGGPQLASYLDLLCANHEATRPLFPFIARLEDGHDQLAELGLVLSSSVLPKLGTGFSTLENLLPALVFESLQPVLVCICDYTRIIASHSNANKPSMSQGVLGDMRNRVQHSLLSLSPFPSIPNHRDSPETNSDTTSPMFESLFSAILIYTWLLTFPAPLESMPLSKIAGVLVRHLRLPRIQHYWAQAPDLMLWMTMMGTLATFNSRFLEVMFLQILRNTARRLNLTEWHEVEETLGRFLWVPEVNGVDGREIWTRVGELQDVREGERPDPRFW